MDPGKQESRPWGPSPGVPVLGYELALWGFCLAAILDPERGSWILSQIVRGPCSWARVRRPGPAPVAVVVVLFCHLWGVRGARSAAIERHTHRQTCTCTAHRRWVSAVQTLDQLPLANSQACGGSWPSCRPILAVASAGPPQVAYPISLARLRVRDLFAGGWRLNRARTDRTVQSACVFLSERLKEPRQAHLNSRPPHAHVQLHMERHRAEGTPREAPQGLAGSLGKVASLRPAGLALALLCCVGSQTSTAH